MRRRLAEQAIFFREFLRNFHTTGAILPSGRPLSAALTRFVREPSAAGRRILEVGPGTGAVTRRIVVGMSSHDSLDLVELNDSFVERLRHRFQVDPEFHAVADRSRVLHCPIEQLPLDHGYDLIVSGLPLNNFALADVESILAAFGGLLAANGVLSFFEYIAVRRARAIVSGPRERSRLRGIGRALSTLLDGREIRRDAVWRNVPPAWVHHVRY
jgi:phosphatidylethanolamine/phosphatidyl-N-methylethanolamine N-methyltransferase